jgi:hypothetical protein
VKRAEPDAVERCGSLSEERGGGEEGGEDQSAFHREERISRGVYDMQLCGAEARGVQEVDQREDGVRDEADGDEEDVALEV